MRIYIVTIIAFSFLLSLHTAMATTYWVSPTGTAANLAACSGATPMSGTQVLYGAAPDYGAYESSVGADTADPTITAFSLAWSSGLTATITFTASDDVALHPTPYCVSETNDADDCTWEASAPETHTWTTPGLKTLYAFARDAAGNVSDSSSTTVNMSMPAATIGSGPSATVGSGPVATIY